MKRIPNPDADFADIFSAAKPQPKKLRLLNATEERAGKPLPDPLPTRSSRGVANLARSEESLQEGTISRRNSSNCRVPISVHSGNSRQPLLQFVPIRVHWW